MLTAWYLGPVWSYSAAAAGGFLWLISDALTQSYSHPALLYWNGIVRFGIFFIVSFILQRLREQFVRQQEANLRLERANKEILRLAAIKSEFTSMVSHELRTPLTAIKESLGIIHDGSAGPLTADQEDFLKTAVRNVERLGRLINDVLDFQKLESGRMQFRLEEACLNDVLQEVAEGFRPVARRKGLQIHTRLEKNLPRIRLDRDRLTQVVTNLLHNAIHYSERGIITLRSQNLEDGIYAEVQDEGRGIRTEDLPKLFESFVQLDGKREGGGSGLGLAISKKIIEQHQGEIGVKSEWGRGSTFYFTLKKETNHAA